MNNQDLVEFQTRQIIQHWRGKGMRDIITKKVAAGLRAMGKQPAGFVFVNIEGEDWTWDKPTILGIPVLHAIGLICYNWASHSDECRFVPVGSSSHSLTPQDRKAFAEAYNDYQLEPEPCLHPFSERYYIGRNLLKCNICGAEFS